MDVIEPHPTATTAMGSVTISEPVQTPNEIVLLQVDDVPKVRSKVQIFAILVALYLALFIAALDQTMLATSTPIITSQLQSASGYAWIGGAYLLANAAAGPIWAKGSDIWGRKPALLGAVAVFAAGSLIAALSVNMRMLIASRALQGAAGGGLIQLMNITVSDLFSMRSRTLYLGLVEVMWALAGGAGPLIGGTFTQLVSWRWCFWINLPVCGIAFILLVIFLDVHNPRTRFLEGILAIDWFGTLSILAVTLMLLLGLDFGGATFPWKSPQVICLVVFGTLMVAVFLYSERKLAKYPLMPLSIFNQLSNNAVFVACFAHGMVFIAAEYYMPLYFQSVRQASPIHSGVLILPITCSEAGMGILVAVFMHQTGRYREVFWAGLALMTLGTGLYITFGANTPIARVVGFELLGGIGAGLLFEAPMIAIQNTVSQQDTATATASIGFARNMATSMSVVFGGVVFQNGMDNRAASLRAAGLSSDVVDALSGGKAAANFDITRTIADPIQLRAVQDAFASSMRDMWIMYTCIAAVGTIASVFIKHKNLSREHTETKTGIPRAIQQRLGEQTHSQ